MYDFAYHRPKSLADAVSLLKGKPEGRVMSGGMTLIPTLKQRLAHALGDAAMDLALDDHRIDDVAEIVDRGEIHDLDFAGVGVDLDLADLRARRIDEVRRVIEGVLVHAGLELGQRVVVRHIGREYRLRQRHVLVGAGHLEGAVLEHDVGHRCFHQMGGDLLALGDDLVGGFHDRRTADG